MAAIVPCEHGWAPGICVTCLQRQLQQARERADENYRLYEALRGEIGKAITAAEQAIERVAQAERRLGLEVLAHKDTKQDAVEQRALAERLKVEIGHWVAAYGPDLIVYPSKEEIRAVNKTPEFRIGRNGIMQVVSEGLQAILDAPAEALRAKHRSPQSGQKKADGD